MRLSAISALLIGAILLTPFPAKAETEKEGWARMESIAEMRSSKTAKKEKKKKELPAKYDNIYMLENVVEAEAGNQDLKGRRLVACVVLNRVDSKSYPNTITGVITQKYQFSTYWNGAMKRHSKISALTKKAVRQELKERSDPSIFYFTAGGYGRYGTPAYKYGAHYFSAR